MDASPPSGLLGLANHRRDGTVTVTVAGELDVATAGDLRVHVEEALRGDAARVVLEMTEVSFIAAAGLGVLVALADSAAGHDTMFRLGQVSPAVTRLLEITGLDERFPTDQAGPPDGRRPADPRQRGP